MAGIYDHMLTPMWKIQKKSENEMLKAALGPIVGKAVIKVHEDILKKPSYSITDLLNKKKNK